MKPEEIKPGMKVCIMRNDTPFCNTTVAQYYNKPGFSHLAVLEGVEHPFPIAELRPFKPSGVIKINNRWN